MRLTRYEPNHCRSTVGTCWVPEENEREERTLFCFFVDKEENKDEKQEGKRTGTVENAYTTGRLKRTIKSSKKQQRVGTFVVGKGHNDEKICPQHFFSGRELFIGKKMNSSCVFLNLSWRLGLRNPPCFDAISSRCSSGGWGVGEGAKAGCVSLR